jgi:hypothetical protein
MLEIVCAIAVIFGAPRGTTSVRGNAQKLLSIRFRMTSRIRQIGFSGRELDDCCGGE